MLTQSASHEELLATIATRILEVIRPWRIVLFGSRARGDAKAHSDYDIYVEVDPGAATLRQLALELQGAVSGCGAFVDLKLNERGTIERRRDDPGTIEWNVAREGLVLYAQPDAPPIAPIARVREPAAGPPESLAEWLDTARRDWRHCQLLLESEAFWPDACWFAHQTSEKHLKALLVSCRVPPPRVHDLNELLAAVRAAGCSMPGIDADCKLLTEHAIKPRYPAGNDLGEEDARVAYAAAERVVAAVEGELPRSIH